MMQCICNIIKVFTNFSHGITPHQDGRKELVVK
jgi:hypothetical protein